ncbi:MAG: hypothetical protein GWP02_00045 [Desulfobulbaceae bacterium]|nr:hypothetical protein [Desulfobulbaceae bacterium]
MNKPLDSKQKGDDPIADKAKALFDDSVDRLDAATLSRLNQGRHRALAELERKSWVGHWLRWAPATGVAATVLLAVMVLRGPDGVDALEGSVTVSDFEMLLGEDSLDMLEELEFFLWLEASDLEANANVG